MPRELEARRSLVFGAESIRRWNDDQTGDVVAEVHLLRHRQLELVAVVADVSSVAEIMVPDHDDLPKAILSLAAAGDPHRGAQVFRDHRKAQWPEFPALPSWIDELAERYPDIADAIGPAADLLALATTNGWDPGMTLDQAWQESNRVEHQGIDCAVTSDSNDQPVTCMYCEDPYPLPALEVVAAEPGLG
jgi:hypothetical protein